MRITIRHKLISNLTPSEYYTYSRCNMYGRGQMRGVISEARKSQRRAYAILAENNGHLIGCGLLTNVSLMLYVRKEHRRQGLGTRIYRRGERLAIANNWNMRTSPWDDRSIAFFNSVEKELTGV